MTRDDALDGVKDVDEAKVERRETESTDIGCPKVTDDAVFDERLDDRVALGVAKRHLATARACSRGVTTSKSPGSRSSTSE
jgi:hypothetical protein